MTLSRKYKPGSRQNFSFQNSILYKKAQCCGELPWRPLTCEYFPIVPVIPGRYYCIGTGSADIPNNPAFFEFTILYGNSGPAQATGNNYDLYFGATLIDSKVNAPSLASTTFTNFDYLTQNGTYRLVITNFIGCTETVFFEIQGILKPAVSMVNVTLPSGTCVLCEDTPSELEITVNDPVPGFTYKYSIKGLVDNLCIYNTGIFEPAVYSFINICSDRYQIGVTSYDPDGIERCSYDVPQYLFNPP